MTQMQMLRRAAHNWRSIEDKRIRRHYQRQWIKAVGILGDRWVLAIPVEAKR
jgi:hypothetical protein